MKKYATQTILASVMSLTKATKPDENKLSNKYIKMSLLGFDAAKT